MRKALLVAALLALSGCKTGDPAGAETKEGLAGGNEELEKLFKTTEGIAYALKSGLVTSQYAKEVCSCVFLSKVDHKTCIARSNMYVTELAVTAEVDVQAKKVRAFGKPGAAKELIETYLPGTDPAGINPPFEAQFRADKPWLGCRLVTPPREIPQ